MIEPIEQQIFNEDDLAGLEEDVRNRISALEDRRVNLDDMLMGAKQRLDKIQRLRHARSNGSRPKPDHITEVLTTILFDAVDPLAMKDIHARYQKITGEEASKSTLYGHLQDEKDKRFEIVGERATAKWRLTFAFRRKLAEIKGEGGEPKKAVGQTHDLLTN